MTEMIAMMMEDDRDNKVKTTVMMTNQHRTAQTSKLKIKEPLADAFKMTVQKKQLQLQKASMVF